VCLDVQLGDKLSAYATDSEKEVLGKRLQETEDWLYEDGENETKGVYISKLEELKKVHWVMALGCTGMVGLYRELAVLLGSGRASGGCGCGRTGRTRPRECTSASWRGSRRWVSCD